jgi:hypothetical protein
MKLRLNKLPIGALYQVTNTPRYLNEKWSGCLVGLHFRDKLPPLPAVIEVELASHSYRLNLAVQLTKDDGSQYVSLELAGDRSTYDRFHDTLNLLYPDLQ